MGGADSHTSESSASGCGEFRRSTDADFDSIIGKDEAEFVDRVLSVIKKEVVPKTQEGVRAGKKLFGGAILLKSDFSTVVAVTKAKTGNPLHHGETTALNAFYDLPHDGPPSTKDAIFIATHEPCALCLSGITWAGFDNFLYLVSYEDTKDAFNVPHELRILDEVFR